MYADFHTQQIFIQILLVYSINHVNEKKYPLNMNKCILSFSIESLVINRSITIPKGIVKRVLLDHYSKV